VRHGRWPSEACSNRQANQAGAPIPTKVETGRSGLYKDQDLCQLVGRTGGNCCSLLFFQVAFQAAF
jgi:hypothetical protein